MIHLWKLLARKLVRFAWKSLGLGAHEWSPPYEYVFEITAERVHEYLNIQREEIRHWCIVGGYLGLEVPRLLKTYPNLRVDIFECSTRYLTTLNKKFQRSERITVIAKAVSSETKRVKFHETSLLGSGSVLKLGNKHRELFGSESAESFWVEAVCLDDFYKDSDINIDVLQIDVQGAEKMVLQGASKVLSTTKAVFLEVSGVENLYQDAVVQRDLYDLLTNWGFVLVLLGNDPNRTGNALFVRA